MTNSSNSDEFYPAGSLNTASYDLRADLDRKFFDDPVPFYTRLAKSLATGYGVLELGCGTGRISAAIARLGIAVTGLDLSPAMLDQARANYPDIDWHPGNMCDFDLGRVFDLVIIPFRGLQEVTDITDQRRALDRAFAHLKPGGALALDLMDPDLRYCLPEGDPDFVELPVFPMPDGVGRPDSRLRITAMERTNDPLTQRFSEHWRFEEIGPDGDVRRREEAWHHLRWITRSEMRLMLELSGFVSITEFSDFNGSPPRYASNQVWMAKRPD
ncbi:MULTISPECIES: class I SAM-dependent methyltransferase [unclassified Thalassospira]|uniref:class I SAM-dependent methyltransferase n=1 Tax=unclassified Thalassospira TaxID=2648997 RepID=UPI001B2F67F5|nr:class I SAM-dependent methyltransferase [Thalassospira sp.]MBO6770544.1 methyltransferase domain-containing protein [Thalassospira sp.]